MTSFIEIPQVGHRGSDVPSFWVNTADIITLKSTYDNGTEFELRDLGSDEMRSVTRRSYLPIGMFLDKLADMSRWSGVVSWSEETLAAFREPAKARSKAAAEREDASYKRAGV